MTQPEAGMDSPTAARDLIARLRSHAFDRSNLYTSLTAEAANEIERLRDDNLACLMEIRRLAGELSETAEGWPTPNRHSESAQQGIRFIAERTR